MTLSEGAAVSASASVVEWIAVTEAVVGLWRTKAEDVDARVRTAAMLNFILMFVWNECIDGGGVGLQNLSIIKN